MLSDETRCVHTPYIEQVLCTVRSTVRLSSLQHTKLPLDGKVRPYILYTGHTLTLAIDIGDERKQVRSVSQSVRLWPDSLFVCSACTVGQLVRYCNASNVLALRTE